MRTDGEITLATVLRIATQVKKLAEKRQEGVTTKGTKEAALAPVSSEDWRGVYLDLDRDQKPLRN